MHTRPQDSTVTPHARTLPIISNLVINTKNVSSEIKIGLAAAASSPSPALPQQPQFVDRLEPFMPPPPTEESQPTLQDTPSVVPSNIQEDIIDSISAPSSEVVGQKRKRTEDATEIELLDGAPPLKTPCLEVCSTAEAVQEVEDSDSAIIKVTKEDFMCTLCRCLLYEPVSPRCGHTFCKQCIFEAISHNNHCPICRVIIHITPEAGVNSLIKDLIIRSFPGQYGKEQLEARAEDEALASANPADLVITIPIFPLEMVLFPFQLLPMQVFKPQYQLMLSRCLEGGGSFGVLSQINGVASQVGTEAVVENHAQLPDGRSLITCRGARRFEVIETSEMEGYPIAKVRYIKDIEERAAEQDDASATNNASPSPPSSPSSQAEAEELYRQMIELTRTKMGGVLPMIEQKFGPMPTNNIEQFSYWLACLLPFPLEKKQAYLQCRSVMERLRIGQDAFNRR